MPIWIGTDGACLGNGKNNPKSSYAVVIIRDIDPIVFNKVSSNKQITNVLHQMDIAGLTKDELSLRNINEPSTNNKAELIAIIRALNFIRQSSKQQYIIVSDSKLSVNSITTWYESWVKKGTIHEHKNTDLIKEAYLEYTWLNKNGYDVSFKRIHSHMAKPPKDDVQYVMWYINYLADKKCAEVFLESQ